MKSFIYGAFKSTLLCASQHLEIQGLGVLGESNESWQLQCPDRNHYLCCPVKGRLVLCNYRAGLLAGAANLTGQLLSEIHNVHPCKCFGVRLVSPRGKLVATCVGGVGACSSCSNAAYVAMREADDEHAPSTARGNLRVASMIMHAVDDLKTLNFSNSSRTAHVFDSPSANEDDIL